MSQSEEKGVALVQAIVKHYTGIELPEDYVLSIFENDKDYDIRIEAEAGSLDDTYARDGLFEYLAQDLVGLSWPSYADLLYFEEGPIFWDKLHEEIEKRGWKHNDESMNM